MKKVLIISYYWPPAGGGGVQRWLKMSKFLPETGWQPVIYTPSNGEAPVIDESLLEEIHEDVVEVKTPIWEPYDLYKFFTGKKKDQRVYSGFINDGKETWKQKLSVFVRGNLFIPDARKFWIKPSIRFLRKYLKENPVDAIISTGPPHSMHMIGLGVSKKFDIPWIADFRDPWTNIDFYDQLRLTAMGDRRHHRMEAAVLKNATRVVTVTPSWAKDFVKLSGRDDITVITNGYDPADFIGRQTEPDGKFSICHIGSMNKDRNPHLLWKILKEMVNDQSFAEKLVIRLVGQVDHSILQSIEESGLTPFLEHIPFVPHAEVIDHLCNSYLLLLPVNNTPNSMGVVPGKLFEYIGAKRPVIGIGPLKGDSAAILQDSGAGDMIGYEDDARMSNLLSVHWNNFKTSKGWKPEFFTEKYSRKELAEKYAKLLEDLV